MKTYNVEWIREKDVAQDNRANLDEGVYAVESGTGLAYFGRDARYKVLPKFSRALRTAHRVTKEDVSKIYDVLGVSKHQFELRDVDGFGTTGLPQLVIYQDKIELKDPKTEELLNPDDYGIFAPDFDVVRPVKERQRENPYEGIIDSIQ